MNRKAAFILADANDDVLTPGNLFLPEVFMLIFLLGFFFGFFGGALNILIE
jgi:hypothetical protein